MLLGKGPRVFLLTGVDLVTDFEWKNKIVPYKKVEFGVSLPDPSGTTGQAVFEGNFHFSNQDGDYSGQQAHYSGEYICAAQYRQLDLKFEKGRDVKVLSSIDLLPLADWGNGICADEDTESSPGEYDDAETPKSVVISVLDESRGDSGQENFELAELAEVDHENQTINWGEIKRLMDLALPDEF